MRSAPIVHTVTGKFMVLPRDHVHAYVVELENSVVVIDATLALSSAAEVRAKAEATGKPIEAVLMTHGHPDHYTGLAKFADLPRLASQGGLDFAHREDAAKAAVAKGYLGDDYPDERIFPNEIVKDGETVIFGGLTFTFHDLGPGESDSDGMWSFTHDGVLHAFVGDTVANDCHCFFRDGHTSAWLGVLDRLEREFAAPTRMFVGHGASPAPLTAIAWQRGYVNAFRDAVMALDEREALEASRPTQEKVIAHMLEYLPGEATLFLLDYELDVSIPALYKELALAAH